MRIAEATQASGLSAHTIRYYEKSGMIPRIGRGSDGHRRFSQENVAWLILLASLRDTGMPTKEMQRFARLYREGDKTVSARKQMLQAHQNHLDARQAALTACRDLLTYKLARYDDILAGST